MKKLSKIFTFTLITTILVSCGAIKRAANLTRCEFRKKEIDKLNLGNTDVRNVRALTDLGFTDITNLGRAFKNGSLPLDVNFQIEVKNPNDAVAAVNKIEWVLEIDEREMTRGTTNQRIEVQPGQTTTFPLGMRVDLKKVLSGESKNSLLNFAMNLVGAGEEQTRIKLKIKPFFRILGAQIGYPGYIKLGPTFGGGGKVEK